MSITTDMSKQEQQQQLYLFSYQNKSQWQKWNYKKSNGFLNDCELGNKSRK